MFANCLTKDWAHQPPSNCQQNTNVWNSGQNIKFSHLVSSQHSVVRMPSFTLSKLPYFIRPNHQNIPTAFRNEHPLHQAHNLHIQRGKQQDFGMATTSVWKRFHVRDILRKDERAIMHETNHLKKLHIPDITNRQQNIPENTANPVVINDEANMHSNNIPKTPEKKFKINMPKYTSPCSEINYGKNEINNNVLVPSAFSVPIFSGKKENISDSESFLNPTMGMTYFMGNSHMTRFVQNSLTDDIVPKLGPSKNSIKTSFSSEYHFRENSTRLFDAFEDPKDIYGRRLPSPRSAQHSSTSESSYSNIYQNNQERKKFQCPQCRYITDRKNNLMRHIITMHQDSGKILECCGIAFQSKSALREHNSVFHSGGYRCQICNRNFCRKALLRRHLTVHSGQKDFYCNMCGYATSHKSNLERHQKVHNKRCIGRSDVLRGTTSDIQNCDEKSSHANVYQNIQSDVIQSDTCPDIFENEINSADMLLSTDKNFQRNTSLDLDNTSNSSDDESDFEIIDVDKSYENFNFQAHELNTNNEPNEANCNIDIHENVLGEKNTQLVPGPNYERANINQKVLKRKGFFTTRIYSTHGAEPFSHDQSRREKSNRFPYINKRLSSGNGKSEAIDNNDKNSVSLYKTERKIFDLNFDRLQKNGDVKTIEEKNFVEEISEEKQEGIDYENTSGFIDSRLMHPITYGCKENGEDCKCIGENLCSFKFKNTNGNVIGDSSCNYNHKDNNCDCLDDENLCKCKCENADCKYMNDSTHGNNVDNIDIKHCKCTCQLANVTQCNNINSQSKNNQQIGCKCKAISKKCIANCRSHLLCDDIVSLKSKYPEVNGFQHERTFCKSICGISNSCKIKNIDGNLIENKTGCKIKNIDGNLIENKTESSKHDISFWSRRTSAHLDSDYSPSKKYRICLFQYSCSSCHSDFRNQIDWDTHQCSEKVNENNSPCFDIPIVMALRKGQLKMKCV